MKRSLFAFLILSALVGCSSVPSYGPAKSPDGNGYTDTRIDNERFQVSYRAPTVILAYRRALCRAAEIARENGFDYFELADVDGNAVGSAEANAETVLGEQISSDVAVSNLFIRLGKGPVPDRYGAWSSMETPKELRRSSSC